MIENNNENKSFFFLTRAAFDSVFHELQVKKGNKLPIGWLLSIIPTLALAVITTKEYSPTFGVPTHILDIVIKIILALSILTLFVLLIIKFINYKILNKKEIITPDMVKEELEKKSEELSMYNILLLIPDFSYKKIAVLAKKHTQWQDAIFLPFIKYKNREDFNKLNNLDVALHNYIKTDINFEWEYLSEMDIYDEIKYHKDEHLHSYNYKFILVYPKSNFLIDIFFKELENNLGITLFPLDYMTTDFNTRLKNTEVIAKINEKTNYLQRRFESMQRKTNRLLWNISEQCNEKCEFCAFGNTSNETHLRMSNLRQVIEQLKKIKIDTIDISTGNIINLDYLVDCISELRKENYNINLTATSKIIEQLDLNFIINNISLIEFSYDSINQDNYRSKDFNNANYLCIQNLVKQLRGNTSVKFRALIIIYSHLTFNIFEKIIKKLGKISVKDVTLIRLMPVGLMENKSYPEILKNKKTYDEYIKHCKDNPNIVTHCSFDGITNNNKKYCNKGITKLSMNPIGDIYSCPWGEHLLTGNKMFCLGNIYTDDIIEIINNQNFLNMKNEKFSCEIFNIENEDYLYK